MSKQKYRKAQNQAQDTRSFKIVSTGIESLLRPERITPETASRLSTVYACQKIISETIAMLPLVLYKDEGVKSVAQDHPLFELLYRLPNKEVTSIEFRTAILSQAIRYGNGFAQKSFDSDGNLVSLWNLDARSIEIAIEGDEVFYIYTRPDGTERVFKRFEIFHIKSGSENGIVGLSPITEVRQAFEGASAIDGYGRAFYENGARPGGVLQVDGIIDQESAQALREDWNRIHKGSNNSNKIAILEGGTKYIPFNQSQSDQQFLEQKQYSRAEIAAIFRVPLHFLNDMQSSGYNSLEQMSQQFIDYTLSPWINTYEQAIYRDLLTVDERKVYYAKHKVQALLRGDSAARAAYYNSGFNTGWLRINDIREFEDMNPLPNGDNNFVQLNMSTVDNIIAPKVVDPATRNIDPFDTRAEQVIPQETRAVDTGKESIQKDREDIANSWRSMFEDAASRMTAREVRDIQRLIEKVLRKKSSVEFIAAVEDFYKNGDFGLAVKKAFSPILVGVSAQIARSVSSEIGKDISKEELSDSVAQYLDIMVRDWNESSIGQITSLADSEEELNTRLDSWNETKGARVGFKQAFESVNVLAVSAYTVLGVTKLRWYTSGGACKMCQSMSGRVIGIDEVFLKAGDEVNNGVEVVKIGRNVKHAGLHEGCQCGVLAG